MKKNNEALRPIDTAIAITRQMLSTLERARQDNYAPSITAKLWMATDEHTRIKYFIDREVLAQSVSWAHANAARREENSSHPGSRTGEVTLGSSCEAVQEIDASDEQRSFPDEIETAAA